MPGNAFRRAAFLAGFTGFGAGLGQGSFIWLNLIDIFTNSFYYEIKLIYFCQDLFYFIYYNKKYRRIDIRNVQAKRTGVKRKSSHQGLVWSAFLWYEMKISAPGEARGYG